MSEMILVAALVRAAWGTLLGWPLVSLSGGQSSWGPLRNPRRLLQAHLNNLFMAALQLGVAAGALEAPAWVVWLLVAGSWINPQLFLLQAVCPELTLKQASSRSKHCRPSCPPSSTEARFCGGTDVARTTTRIRTLRLTLFGALLCPECVTRPQTADVRRH